MRSKPLIGYKKALVNCQATEVRKAVLHPHCIMEVGCCIPQPLMLSDGGRNTRRTSIPPASLPWRKLSGYFGVGLPIIRADVAKVFTGLIDLGGGFLF